MAAGLLLGAASGCKKTSPSAVGGTIVLSVDATRRVDQVKLFAYDPAGDRADFSFSTGGQDLSQAPMSGEVTPGALIQSGHVLFVGFGYQEGSMTPVASGRVEAEFVPGERRQAKLTLRGDVVDADQDGFSDKDDCNDQSSKQNPFLAEKCDNALDDNCNGSVDENCPCSAGMTRRCYGGPDLSLRGIGECLEGHQECAGGTWSACIDWKGPSAEINNGKDDDCDGSVDEDMPCTPGTQRWCFQTQVSLTNQQSTALDIKGECAAGVQKCLGSAWDVCRDAKLPKAEACNGLDDDCNGEIDDGFDNDQDGFTTCGTLRAQGCGGGPFVKGVDPQYADCDDGDVKRHPCQADRCGDNGYDDDCKDGPNECQGGGGTCAAKGYYGGWVSAGGRASVECRYLAGSYAPTCPAGVCQDDSATACKATNGVSATAATGVGQRPVCRSVSGCDAGSRVAPVIGAAVTAGTDPYGDCGGYRCDGTGGTASMTYYYGWVQDSDEVFRCYYRDNPPDDQVHCATDGTCETATSACARYNVQGSANGTEAPVCWDHDASTCQGITTPTISRVADGDLDPAGRCATTQCDGMVLSDNWSGASCTVVASSAKNQTVCQSGSCAPISPAGCANAATTIKTCDDKCKVPTACSPSAKPTYFCYDARLGHQSQDAENLCDPGSTCFSKSGTEADSKCNSCTTKDFCGTNCERCAASGQWCPGSSGGCADCNTKGHCGPSCVDCGTQTCKNTGGVWACG